MTEVRDSLSFLLLPKEKVFVREKAYCIDILTSTDRVKLLEKFLSKRYTLVSGVSVGETSAPVNEGHCQLEFTSIRTKEATDEVVTLKKKKILTKKESHQETSVSEILLVMGKPGLLEVGSKTISMECQRGASGTYQLSFFLSEQDKTKVSSQVSVRAGETVNITEVCNDLNEKNKILGIPEISFTESQSKDKVDYQLKVKQESP